MSTAARQRPRADAAQRLIDQGRGAEGVALMIEAAQHGDRDALFALANWRLFGHHGPKDPPAALKLAQLAAARGHGVARLMEAALVAEGVGCAADPEAARRLLDRIDGGSVPEQRALLDAMAERPDPVVTVLRDAPYIATIEGLLSPAECAHLIREGGSRLMPSQIYDGKGGAKADPMRSSDGMSFSLSTMSPVISAINRRFARVSGTEVKAGEPLQVLRYRPGQLYKPHLDCIPGEKENQRDWTVLGMLSPAEEGGETRFDAIGLTVRLKAGEGLMFRNVTPDGAPDHSTVHSGLPVIRGEKWLTTRWIRRHPLVA